MPEVGIRKGPRSWPRLRLRGLFLLAPGQVTALISGVPSR